jgi:cell division protein FtsB
MISKIVCIGLLLFDTFLAFKFVWSENGYVRYKQQCHYEQELVNMLAGLESETYEMSQNIRLLQKDSLLLEKEIRCRLHYAKPHEVMYLMSDE